MSNLFVLGLGLGTVFVGLICIIILCKLMSAICSKFGKNPTQPKAALATAAAAPAEASIPNRQEFIAAVAAAIAEEMRTEVSKIRILSVKKI